MSNSPAIRADIQALRAVAVIFVVIFHLWPNQLPGGFAGVDVFFVISGFLISGSLFGELATQGRISVANFWAKRIRRLLPAVFLVIAISGLAMTIFVPPFTRSEFVGHAIASLFYFENWNLIGSAASYFTDSNASPFQHFWSLAVEEQFYVFWPILLLVLVKPVQSEFKLPKESLPWLIAPIALLTLTSFFTAVAQVASDPAGSYFNSYLRIWQFGLGAAVAFVLRWRQIPVQVGAFLSGIGFTAVLLSGFVFNGAAGFPATPALLPTLGAVAVILGGAKGQARIQDFACRLPGIQFLGNVSYSLYLWHWPLIIISPFVLNRTLNDIDRFSLLFVSIVLAWFSKFAIEDRFRAWPWLVASKPQMTFILASTVSILLASGLSLSTAYNLGSTNGPFISLDQAKHDASDVGMKCMTKAEDSEVKLCNFGHEESNYRVLLVGDSHAGSQLAGFKRMANKHSWALTLAYKAGCSFNSKLRNKTPRGVSCAAWNKSLNAKLAHLPPFDLVVTASYSNNFLADDKTSDWQANASAGFINSWQPLINRGAKVVALRDNPQMTDAMKSCWDSAIRDASGCLGDKYKMLFPDPSQTAADELSGAYALDLTDLYCTDQTCNAMVGGTYVYRNADHISSTYSTVISSGVYQRLQNLLGGTQ